MLRAILAAFVGTGLMTISSTTEMQWSGREPSVAPGLAAATLLRLFGIPDVKGRALDVLSTWVHWGHGTLWGLLFWALIGPAALPLWAAGAVFFLVVWGAEQLQPPAARDRSVAMEVGYQSEPDRHVAPRRLRGRHHGRVGTDGSRRRMSRPGLLLGPVLVVPLVLGACTDAGEPPVASSPEGPAARADEAPADPTELTRDDLTQVIGPDSIPSIDDPTFLSPRQAEGWLDAREPVAVLVIGNDARAYPLQIMTWHEIVNDVVGGEPVAVTYCPLCNSALAYPRTVRGQILDFGTSGSLYNSALVMYDRQTESLWLHFEGLAIEGPLEGTRLEFIPVQVLSFEQFRDEHPDGTVLSRDTGFSRDYGRNPYELYDTTERPFLFEGEIDDRLDAIARVVGVEIGEEAVAYPYEVLAGDGGASVIHDTVGAGDIVVFWKAGVRSALDSSRIEHARDVGSSGVFRPDAGDRMLTFRTEGDRLVDEETASTWSLAGRATGGRLAGRQLQRVQHLDTFWFAWSSHKPHTRIFRG